MKTVKLAKPFLKWAGGKSQLIPQLERFFPKELAQGSIQRYIEPFVGGGAVFLHIANYYNNVEEFVIVDINPELILAYQTIQKNVEGLIEILEELQNHYFALTEPERKQYFYQIRRNFNQNRQQINFETYQSSWLQRTAQLIFLNRTCYNGLFRVNSKGEFNVPFGRYKNPQICNADNLRLLAQLLQKTHIRQGDFTECEPFVNCNSLVYFDPPYRPLNQTANFQSYAKNQFNDTEQLRLRDLFQCLDQKQAKLILSNSDPKNQDPTDNFFEKHYANYRIKTIQAARSINSKGNKRGKINELIILNY